MAISLVGAGTLSAAAASFVNCALPADLAAGDCLFLFAFGRSNAANVVLPRGWTLVYQQSATLRRLCVYQRHYAPTELAGTTVQFSQGGTTTAMLARVVAFRTNTAGKVVYHSTLGAGYTATGVSNIGNIGAPSSPPATGGVVFFGARTTSWTSVGTLSGDSLTWTELLDDATAAGGTAGMVADFASWTSTPTLTAKTFTVTGGSSGDAIGRSFLLTEKPRSDFTWRDRNGAVPLLLSRQLPRPISMPLIQAA